LQTEASISYVNYSARELNVKIVYCGPISSGAESCIEYIFSKTPPDSRGKLIRFGDGEDAGIFFNFAPRTLDEIRGLRVRFHLYSLPAHAAGRRVMLRNVDAIVLVADARVSKQRSNVDYLAQLQSELAGIEGHYELGSSPFVIQYNRSQNANGEAHASRDALSRSLNASSAPEFETFAAEGLGIFDALKAVAKLVLIELRDNTNLAPKARSAASVHASSTNSPEASAPVAAAIEPAAIKPAAIEPAAAPRLLTESSIESIASSSEKPAFISEPPPPYRSRGLGFDPAAVEKLERLTRQRERPRADESELLKQARERDIDELVRELLHQPAPRTGDVVLDCRLEKVVGKGHYGTVWVARHEPSRKQRAIKFLDRDRLGLGLYLYHFRRGVKAMEHLERAKGGRPAGIVRLYDVDPSMLAFSMRYLAGGNLYEFVRRLRGLRGKLRVFRTVCEAVQFAHSHSVLHRDIKPANIVMTPKGKPVLTDFDIADLLFVDTMTATGAGTIHYAAPEQFEKGEGHRSTGLRWKNERRDPTADVFSLGRLLQFLLLEKDPQARFEDVPDLLELNQQPEGLVRIVRKCTLRDPAKRYASVAELLTDFDVFASSPSKVGIGSNGVAVPSMSAKSVQPQPPMWRRESIVAALVAAAAALGAAVVGILPKLIGIDDDEKHAPAVSKAEADSGNSRRSRAPTNDEPKATSQVRGAVGNVTTDLSPASSKTTASTEVTIHGSVELVRIPGGTFAMGSPDDEAERGRDEGPQHQVTISDFWIGKYEVTNAQFSRFLQANPEFARPRELTQPEAPDRPATNVSWNTALAYARWDGARLLREAEWEYAARAGTIESRYGTLAKVAWFDENADDLQRVGMRAPNAFGVYDMLGNVWEWCSDPYGPYEASALLNPSGARKGPGRVLRGGSWNNPAKALRAANRLWGAQDYAVGHLGFRIARDIAPAKLRQ